MATQKIKRIQRIPSSKLSFLDFACLRINIAFKTDSWEELARQRAVDKSHDFIFEVRCLEKKWVGEEDEWGLAGWGKILIEL